MRNMNDFQKAASFARIRGHDLVSGGAWIARCTRCGQSAYADDPRWAEKCQPIRPAGQEPLLPVSQDRQAAQAALTRWARRKLAKRGGAL